MESDKKKQRFELCEAILLSVAIVLTAWSGYQAARWSGIQALRLADAAVASRTALEMHLFTEAQYVSDGTTILHIVDALVEGRSNLVEFYVKRIRPELRAPVEAWLALKPIQNPDAPAHPLVMPQYLNEVLGVARAKELKLRDDADEQMALAREGKQVSERYVLFSVLLAAVLFFTGIAGKFAPGWTRIAMITFAAIALGIVAVLLATSPIAGKLPPAAIATPERQVDPR